MQTKKSSLIEVLLNTGSGMVIAYCTMQYVLSPLLNIDIDHRQNIIVTIVLTTVSVIRGYVWRRFFNLKSTKCNYRKLSERDSVLVAEKLINPPEPNEKLKELFNKNEGGVLSIPPTACYFIYVYNFDYSTLEKIVEEYSSTEEGQVSLFIDSGAFAIYLDADVDHLIYNIDRFFFYLVENNIHVDRVELKF